MYTSMIFSVAFAIFLQISLTKSEFYEHNEVDSSVEGRMEKIMPLECECEDGLSCLCCAKLQSRRLSVNQTACVELEYIGEKTALKVQVTSNDKVLFEDTISANNPPPICVNLPRMRAFVDFCIDFSEVELTNEYANLCLNNHLRMLRRPIIDQDMGCITLRSNSTSSM